MELSFCDWLISLSVMSLRIIMSHIFKFLFLRLKGLPLYAYTAFLKSIHLWVNI